ncbi:hypothetical protein EIN_487650 [Entamoeba invadens IP1]|uniref:Rab-GAP TBC domain-containing protein n=1 Tax=Entamoeba invadens IP1 TaxID=370355 RepID=A0A0A1UAT5_ENTIV|nr:hypothetical protein EIN_487650 [Entamoeba invadens IP1]ELP89263.1 hypothetical protein EIN_487650 [Entamoeba invadens IP1]|eukprot:XP_004256034.1 hypothetical protein EIN_487650 [Entamoeba invadens IP1]
MSSEENDSYDEGYSSDDNSSKVSLHQVTREVSGKTVTELVSPPFYFAVTCGRQELFDEKQLPPNLSVQDSKLNFKSKIDGATALHIAVELGKSNLVKQFLLAGITQNTRDNDGNTALIRGAIAGRTNSCVYVARKIKKSGIDLKNTRGDSALYIACRKNNVKLVEKLVRYGGDVNITNTKQVTPLMVACFYMNLEIMQFLINAGAKIDRYDTEHSNCLHYMAKSTNFGNVTNYGPYFDYFRKSAMLAEAEDVHGNQPLHYALQSKFEPLVNFLLNITSMKDVRLVYNEVKSQTHDEIPEDTFKTPRERQKEDTGYSRESFMTREDSKIDEEQDNEKTMRVILDEWSKTKKVPKELFRQIYRKVPNDLRKPFWELQLKVEESISDAPGYYKRISELEDRGKDDGQIHKDVIRAHQNNVHFMTKYMDGQMTLFRVLRTWALGDKDIGYVQGFSDLCGYLVLVLQNEEEVYWAFNMIINGTKYNLREMCLPGFPGVQRCSYVAMKMIKKYHTSIFKHLQNVEYDFVTSKTYMLEYFMLWFSRCFPLEVELKILDLILMEGWEILFTVFSAILHFSKPAILEMDEFIYIDKALVTPVTLMAERYSEETFFEFIRKERITPKEISAWYKSAPKPE